MGAAPRQARLAVVLTRGDLADGQSSHKVSRWASRELGLGELVRSARHDFKECRFFCAAALMRDDVMHESVESLMSWLLTGAGISPAPSRVVADLSAARERSYRCYRRCVFASMVASAVLLILLFAR